MTKEELFELTNSEMLVELSRNEIIFITPDEKVVFMNPKALLLRGLKKMTDYSDLSLEELYSKGTAAELRSILSKLVNRQVIYADLCTRNDITNELIYLDSRVTTFRTDDKKLQGFAIISFDISSEVHARKELVRSQNYLHSIIETASDGIITINSAGIIQSVNRAAAQLFGYEPEEMAGQNISMMMPLKHGEKHDSYIDNYHQTGIGKIIGVGREVKGMRKDGKTFPFRLSISRVIIEENTFFTGIVHDLTEQKKAEAKLKELNKELEKRVQDRTEELADTVNKLLIEIGERKNAQALLVKNEVEIKNALKKERELSDLKSRFISTASHEFRTPLAAIGLSASLIGKYDETNDPSSQKRNKHIERIQSNVKTVTDILTDFLSLSRLEAGKLENNPSLLNVKEFSEKIISDLTGFKKDKQEIHYKHIGNKLEAFLDSFLLKNVIINLLSNAVKYSEEGGNIYFQTEINANNFQIRVKDEGIGIPEEDQKFLFDRFFRATNVDNIQGTGLGLNLVEQYVKTMNGDITFKSKESKGTSFIVTIPL